MLSPDKYIAAVSLTQIVSLDLIVKDNKGRVLVGMRKNKPAKDFYFVPGGRIFKNESLPDGCKRQIREELGVRDCDAKVTFRCVSDHMYEDNFLGAVDKSGKLVPMHYVCIGMNVTLLTDFDLEVFKLQHKDALWLSEEELLRRDDVHKYTKMYFTKDAPNRI